MILPTLFILSEPFTQDMSKQQGSILLQIVMLGLLLAKGWPIVVPHLVNNWMTVVRGVSVV
jgi:hypothetical protein